ncbi:hypothetical protein [Herbiconiux sp. VKM Ac-2851]|uniref:hypothetical protein n=1 Tax=Herbiconiux sp. VKM Ac-2851 TaxID=2739025 RepID=UPI001565ACFC|nr:hypothetical protein [Herbiconiux sp. VKM Ac-2851]NQX34478.1 hypothetical protein [Herbiconiux sp. VKM Ac-2851]
MSTIKGFTVTGNNYVTQAHANAWAHYHGAAFTVTGFASGPTPNQYAASKGRAYDEWGFVCEGGPTFSTYPNSAVGQSCDVGGRSFYSQGTAYGYNTSTGVWNYTLTTVSGYEAPVARSAGLEGIVSGEAEPVGGEPANPTDWPVNADGLTYGNAALATSPNDEPDLITATGTNGERGYVLRSELRAANGELALESAGTAAQARAAASSSADQTVSVYTLDGDTVLGSYLIVGTDTQEEQLQSQSDAE